MKHVLSRLAVGILALGAGIIGAGWAQAPLPASNVPYSQVKEEDMREWLGYLASDELLGRQVFTEGYGLAAQYVAAQLKSFGVEPIGGGGSYMQPVKLKGYRAARNTSVTVEANGQSRTFKHGDHVSFPPNIGAPQTLTFDGVEFLGYGLPADFEGRDLKGKLVLIVPNLAPAGRGGGQPAGGARGARGAGGAITSGAAAAVTFSPTPSPPTPAEQALAQAQTALNQANTAVVQAQQALRGGNRGAAPAPAGARGTPAGADFTTVQRIDGKISPQFTGDETFFDALLGTGVASDIRAKAGRGEVIPPMSIAAKVVLAVDHTYEVVTEQVSHNVAGIVRGSDPALTDTYVLFGAHLDHVGYSQNGTARGGAPDACRRRSPAAQAAVTASGRTVQRGGGARGPATAARGGPAPLGERDIINNGADDDGSGSASLLAVAKAFATGPKPKRSVVFIWHTGEEAGLYGSRYNADFPVVPLDKVQAQLNMDMVGRDDCDNLEGDYTNTLFLVGADRISTDLHNLIVRTNSTLPSPLTLDYELNDLNDPENVYTRSDHYSYAAKGIPIAFFTTGLHPDYHRVTDSVEKIRFPKMARIAQLVYEVGFSIANASQALERDNKGPRTGFGSKAEILPQ